MNNSPLEAIKEAEKKAEKDLIKAREDTGKMIAEAKKQREQLIIGVETEKQKFTKQLQGQVKKETKKETDQIIKQAEAEKQKIEQ